VAAAVSAPHTASQDRWAENDTTPERIESALRELLRERHASNEALAPARVLNLVVIVDRDWKGEIANRLDRVGRYHASRTILCAVEPDRRTIDAAVVMSSQEPTGGAIGVLRERVELDIGPVQLKRIDTVIDPIIVSALPTVLWSPHGHDEAVEALLEMVDVVLIDSDDLADFDGPAAGLRRAAELSESVYVVDLAWLRTTPWRERLAAAFDAPSRRDQLRRLERIVIRHHSSSIVSALLLAGWLASRLGWKPRAVAGSDGSLRAAAGSTGGEARGPDLEVEFEPVGQSVPGIAGVTVAGNGGFALSLDRGAGGLTARQESEDGTTREWQVLGASRGEGGILGEGVRQALLRDPTYAPALAAARGFSP
jgi:glucose-6-phosphate dehydrogenase assembly protein OpcA